jgi:hypothetical protein
MAISDSGKTTAAGALAAVIDTIKLHSASPGAAGTTAQISGASSACSYVAGAAGTIDVSSTVTVNVASGNTVSHFSLWDGATFIAAEVFTSNPETYANAGVANVTSAAVTLS